MKRWRVILMVAMVALLLTGCCLSHEWADATCEEPKTCTKCGKTEGDALGHTWVDADCVNPKTCSVCKKTDGEALGHKWVDADCTKPKTCSVCGETEGEALGHKWVDADCTKPKTCSVCGATEGEALGHKWKAATCTAPQTCSVCNEITGSALGHQVETKVRFDFTNSLAIGEEVCSRCAKVINSHSAALATLTEDSVFIPSAEEFYQRLQYIAQLEGFEGEIKLTADRDGDVVCYFSLNRNWIATLNFKDIRSDWISYDSKGTQFMIHSLFLYSANNFDDFFVPWACTILACDPTQEVDDSLIDLIYEMTNFSPVKNGIQYQFTDLSEEAEAFLVEIFVK